MKLAEIWEKDGENDGQLQNLCVGDGIGEEKKERKKEKKKKEEEEEMIKKEDQEGEQEEVYNEGAE